MIAVIIAGMFAVASPHPQPKNVAVWDQIAVCESGSNWHDTAGLYEGALQFLNSTWLANGGGRYAPHAYEATKRQQIRVANRLLAITGWKSWPQCSLKLGLR